MQAPVCSRYLPHKKMQNCSLQVVPAAAAAGCTNHKAQRPNCNTLVATVPVTCLLSSLSHTLLSIHRPGASVRSSASRTLHMEGLLPSAVPRGYPLRLAHASTTVSWIIDKSLALGVTIATGLACIEVCCLGVVRGTPELLPPSTSPLHSSVGTSSIDARG